MNNENIDGSYDFVAHWKWGSRHAALEHAGRMYAHDGVSGGAREISLLQETLRHLDEVQPGLAARRPKATLGKAHTTGPPRGIFEELEFK